MGILATLKAKRNPLDRETIIALSEDCIYELQADPKNIRARDELFYLHLGLIQKVVNQNIGKFIEADSVSICLECIVPAAVKYDVVAGHKRFAWVSFYMQRCKWAINEAFFKTSQLVYIPRVPWENGHRHEYSKSDVEILDGLDTVEDDSLPTRWEAAYVYETNNTLTEQQKEDLVMFKLAWKNKDISKIAKARKIKRKEVTEALVRVQEAMQEFFLENKHLIP